MSLSGPVLARTDGYSGALMPRLARPAVAINSLQVATVPLSDNVRPSMLPLRTCPGTDCFFDGMIVPFGARLTTTEPERVRAAEPVRATVLNAVTVTLDYLRPESAKPPHAVCARARPYCMVAGDRAGERNHAATTPKPIQASDRPQASCQNPDWVARRGRHRCELVQHMIRTGTVVRTR